ncbi:hypothetical protein [Paenibacillus sp.]|uniref:hypothetical protein n=1 Tax=Paenibacillus sp. TaxID=58172 RepID=UPI0028114305|nr:hypothetical protein [Paenibacillus sp.]
MQNKNIAIITAESSDLSELMLAFEPTATLIKPGEVSRYDLDRFEAIALLGGVSDKPLLLAPEERLLVEKEIRKGKRVFAEYAASIGHMYASPPQSTRFERLVYCAESPDIDGLTLGDVLDDQSGMRIKPHDIACSHGRPILTFASVNAHGFVEVSDEMLGRISDRALWFEEPDRLLVCSFRLCRFRKARFAPHRKVAALISYILGWFFRTKVDLGPMRAAYSFVHADGGSATLESRIAHSVERAMAWFEKSGVLRDEGRGGVWEGMGTEIAPDGTQRVSAIRRVDCIGEAALPYFLNYLYASNERDLLVSERLHDYVFDYFLNKEPGELYGMMRWTEEAWGVCYQDDVARALIPHLLKCLYTGSRYRLDEAADALRFLVKTTGTDGTRVFRTDNLALTEEKLRALRSEPGRLPSAHYNGYYWAALFLAYKLTGERAFLETGVRGMKTLLDVYPDTVREQSQTQEYCRLILPLAWMYWATGEERHKEWLYRVAEDLQSFKHPSGAYLEWDEGYQAAMRHGMGEGESSLLAKNGDPVADLLYSNNWLPIAYMQAYFVTKDEWFLRRWEEHAAFLLSAQLAGDNPQIDGAWARAFDVELHEVYGNPADAGWGPWAIESGWTVAEIASGLLMGLLKHRLRPAYE